MAEIKFDPNKFCSKPKFWLASQQVLIFRDGKTFHLPHRLPLQIQKSNCANRKTKEWEEWKREKKTPNTENLSTFSSDQNFHHFIWTQTSHSMAFSFVRFPFNVTKSIGRHEYLSHCIAPHHKQFNREMFQYIEYFIAN